ncbi:MAG: hypothetical protein K9I36_09150 [Bacteroidia bacterium]|nr:hypothetical protein [Bacteroidia bacterium]MCF8426885.1 hypothetical protein [Bacteroidia bacterium]
MKGNLLFFACIVFILVSCRRDLDCPEDDIYRYQFVEEDTNVLFYAIHDTITFVNQNFDEITFVCTDKKYGTYSTVEYDGLSDCGHRTLYVSDRIEFVFKPYGNSHKFVYTITADKNFITSPENKMFFDEDLIFIANSRWSGAKNTDSILFNGNYLGGFPLYYFKNVLLNLDYGLIKFKDKNENIWTLKEKK